MTRLVLEISALVGCTGIAIRSALRGVAVIWSLKAGRDEDGRRHARELLEILQGDRHKAADRFRAVARKIPCSGEASGDTDGDDRV
jgi:hypothetical protein